MCVRACVRAWVHACVCVWEREREKERERESTDTWIMIIVLNYLCWMWAVVRKIMRFCEQVQSVVWYQSNWVSLISARFAFASKRAAPNPNPNPSPYGLRKSALTGRCIWVVRAYWLLRSNWMVLFYSSSCSGNGVLLAFFQFHLC